MSSNVDLKTASLVIAGSVGISATAVFLYKRFLQRKHKTPYIAGVVSELHVFPVKSFAGIQVDSFEMEKYGPAYDRHWVLVNHKNILQTQRQMPKMALIRTSFEDDKWLCFNAPGMDTIKIPVDQEFDQDKRLMIDVFGLPVEGLYCGDEVSQWIDQYLGKTGLKLYTGRHLQLHKRTLVDTPIWGDVAKEGDEAMFPDDSPVLVLSEASVAALNKTLDVPVTLLSFRPNIVVRGCGAFEEDSWNTVMIGDVLLRRRKKAGRCILTTVDYEKGIKRADEQPIKTLRRDRLCSADDPDKAKYDKDALFGIYFTPDVLGKINVGDEIIVVK